MPEKTDTDREVKASQALQATSQAAHHDLLSELPPLSRIVQQHDEPWKRFK